MRGLLFNSPIVPVVAGVGALVLVGVTLVHRSARIAREAAENREQQLERQDDAPPPSKGESLPHKIVLPTFASVEIIVLTSAAPEAINALLATPKKLSADPYCGDSSTCAAIEALLLSKAFHAERTERGSVQLPELDAMNELAPDMTAEESRRALASTWAVSLRVSAPRTPDDLALRAMLSAGSVLSGATNGFVYDVPNRRVELAVVYQQRTKQALGAAHFMGHETLFVHRYDDANVPATTPDGAAAPDAGVTTRLMTIGMKGFGLPDLTIGPCAPEDAKVLAGFFLDVEERMATHKDAEMTAPLPVGHVRIDLRRPPRREGDPENRFYWVVPADAPDEPTPEDYAKMARAISPPPPPPPPETVHVRLNDPNPGASLGGRLGEIIRTQTAASERARAALPDAVRVWKATPAATLDVTAGLFGGADGGNARQNVQMAMANVRVEDDDGKTLIGRALASPESSFAANQRVSVAYADVVDFFLTMPDGTTFGGETLRARAEENGHPLEGPPLAALKDVALHGWDAGAAGDAGSPGKKPGPAPRAHQR